MPQVESYPRAIAGHLLKNNIRSYFNNIPLPVLDHVKHCCTEALNTPDVDVDVRRTIASSIAAIVTRGQAHNWPHILQVLVEKLDSPDPVTVEMAFDALAMICEDAARDLDQEMDGVRPLAFMIPKFIQFFYNPDAKLRATAITATSQFIMLQSESFLANMDTYLRGLFARATDESSRVRQEICRSLVMVLEANPEALTPYIDAVINYMIFCTRDENEQVALEACDFWIQFSNLDEMHERLLPYLPRIVPELLKRMVYSDTDLLMLGGDENDAHIPDNEMDIRPRHSRRHRGPMAASHHENNHDDPVTTNDDDDNDNDNDEDDDDDDDEDFDDDEFYSEWTLRKCSAAALDVLSTTYNRHVVVVLLPLLNHNLFSQDWRERESGILALGAAAEGGLEDIAPHLPDMMPYLIQSLNDPKPLIRSITCWALGRFSRWCVEQATIPGGRGAFFEPVLFNLLQRILDKNKRVQEAACSAFATLEEEATIELVPYLEPILINLTTAFNTYQHKNLLILYDALGTLAESVGAALNQPRCLMLMMPPLIAKWNKLSDQDTDLFPLLECLSSVTAALGTVFAPYAEPVFTRCVKLVSTTLHQIFMADQNPDEFDPPDVEFMVVSLDLLSGLVQGLGQLIEPLVANSDPPLLSLLAVCIHDPVTEVLQATYALIGDLAMACFERLRSYLPPIVPELIEQIGPDPALVSVSNNAVWAVGEIAIRWGQDMQPFVEPLLQRLFPLLVIPGVMESLQENATITIGRLGYGCPDILARHLPQFIGPWLEKFIMLRENDEKDTAFQGLCTVIKVNPQGIVDQFNTLFEIIAQYQRPSPPLSKTLSEILMGYKNMLNEEQWKQAWGGLTAETQQTLSHKYGA
ncbi:armadillo-type protein [Zychaea mexicana]|uniref:armadillo-type protein n=1 Tax=Zychaea mexicana TaxID=64656 RepID=UPI0022FE4F6F|nr:armadillo-type protein [Zychaea mexicana]KAI9485129.1 armadillo-type protein [Zychaea mexicana]